MANRPRDLTFLDGKKTSKLMNVILTIVTTVIYYCIVGMYDGKMPWALDGRGSVGAIAVFETGIRSLREAMVLRRAARR